MKLTPRLLVVFAFNLLVLSLPLYFRFQNEELFEFNKMILVYFFTVIIGYLWIFRMIAEKRVIFKKTPLDLPIIFFVFSQLISTIFSIHPHTSWLGYYSRFNGGFFSTLSYVVLFYALVSNLKKKDLGGFFLSALISTLGVSIWGILEHFGHSFSCYIVSGGQTFGVDCWVQKVQERVYASFGQPNWLAAYVITLFPVSFVIATQTKLPTLKRIFFVLTTLALFLVLIYTKSRSGIMGLVFGFGILGVGGFLLYLKNKTEILTKINIYLIGFFLILLSGTALITGTEFTPSVSSLLNSQKESVEPAQNDLKQVSVVNRLEEGGTDSGEIRKIVWTGALNIWKRYPIIGSGVETFAYSYYQDRIREHNDVSEWDFLYNKAHNELLNYLATTGLVGLLTYLSMFVVLALITLKILSQKHFSVTEQLLVLSLFAGQGALFVSNFFGFATVGVNVLMYLFFAITCLIYIQQIHDQNQTKKESQFLKSESVRYLAISIISILGLFLLFKVYNYWSADKAYAQGKYYFNVGQHQFGIQKLVEAINRSPNEALYYDTLSDRYAVLAVELAKNNDSSTAAQFVNESVNASNATLMLNNRHLNFYKTRGRVMVTLSQLDEKFLQEATSTLLEAVTLSPTDPKLYFTLAAIEESNGNTQKAIELYQKSLELKPDYERPLWKLSEIYELQEDYETALGYLNYILENVSPNNPEILAKKTLLEEKLKIQK
jgi:putative inorganic carbon (hco3(-)) transporter